MSLDCFRIARLWAIQGRTIVLLTGLIGGPATVKFREVLAVEAPSPTVSVTMKLPPFLKVWLTDAPLVFSPSPKSQLRVAIGPAPPVLVSVKVNAWSASAVHTLTPNSATHSAVVLKEGTIGGGPTGPATDTTLLVLAVQRPSAQLPGLATSSLTVFGPDEVKV